MNPSPWTLATLVSTSVVAFGAPGLAEDLTVFVTAGAAASRTEAAKKADARLEALAKERKDLEDSLKKQYGKKREQWPADKKAEFDKMAALVRRLSFEHNFRNYAGATAKDIEESVAGIRRNLDQKKGVRVVATGDQADLRVEVVGRFVGPDELGQNAAKIGLRISAGGRLDPALLARNPISWPEHAARMAGAWAVPWHQYTAEEPFWLVQVERPSGLLRGMIYGKVEAHAAGNIEKLAKESGAFIAAARRSSSPRSPP